jgi:hypothetical protein
MAGLDTQLYDPLGAAVPSHLGSKTLQQLMGFYKTHLLALFSEPIAGKAVTSSLRQTVAIPIVSLTYRFHVAEETEIPIFPVAA